MSEKNRLQDPLLNRKIGRRRFLKAALQSIAMVASAGTSTAITDSATPIGLNQDNYLLKESTGLDLASWKSQFGLNLQEVIPNPYGERTYLVIIDQSHRSPIAYQRTRENIIESGEKITQTQDRIESVLRFFAQKGITEVFSEGITSVALESLNSYRKIKQRFDQENPDSIEYILKNLNQLSLDWQYMHNLKKQTGEGNQEQAFNYNEAIILFIYNLFLQKAANFIQINPGSPIPDDLRDEIMKYQEEEGKGPEEPEKFLLDAIDLFSTYTQKYANDWGFPDIRSTLTAAERLHIENVINLQVAESSELNQEVITTLSQNYARMFEIREKMYDLARVDKNDPEILELAEELRQLLDQTKEFTEVKAKSAREALAIESACGLIVLG